MSRSTQVHVNRRYSEDGHLHELGARSRERSLAACTISVPEAAEMLGISRSHAYECARSGQLPVIRLGARLVVPRHLIEQLLASAGS